MSTGDYNNQTQTPEQFRDKQLIELLSAMKKPLQSPDHKAVHGDESAHSTKVYRVGGKDGKPNRIPFTQDDKGNIVLDYAKLNHHLVLERFDNANGQHAYQIAQVVSGRLNEAVIFYDMGDGTPTYPHFGQLSPSGNGELQSITDPLDQGKLAKSMAEQLKDAKKRDLGDFATMDSGILAGADVIVFAGGLTMGSGGIQYGSPKPSSENPSKEKPYDPYRLKVKRLYANPDGTYSRKKPK